MSIFIVSHFFYTIVINFVIDLSNKFDYLLIIIHKFSCRLQLLLEYITNFVAI